MEDENNLVDSYQSSMRDQLKQEKSIEITDSVKNLLSHKIRNRVVFMPDERNKVDLGLQINTTVELFLGKFKFLYRYN